MIHVTAVPSTYYVSRQLMLKWKSLLGISLLTFGITGVYHYHHNNSFRSLCNLAYAGAHITLIYKNTPNTIREKNTAASEYLREALRNNGGIYLKLGQLIATLDVVIPDQYRASLGALTRECKVAPFQEVKRTVEQQLGYPLEVVFQYFDPKPISSASIAQVHKAVLLNGEQVAVKVQHRDLAEHVQKDLSMLRMFSNAAKWLFTSFHYEWLVEAFQKNLRLQLDFLQQAANMKRTERFLRENGFTNVSVPQLLLRPTRRVLVMEFIAGVHLDEPEKLRRMGIDCRKMGRLFSNVITKMIHKEGFVHADPHAGNLMARRSKQRDELVILDHGLYQEMDPTLVKNYNQFWLGLILNDPKHYDHAARQLGTTNPKMLCAILTSKTEEELNSSSRSLFDLNPSNDRDKIMAEAAKNHQKIVGVLQELKKEILLLLKVNEFARTIENMLGGREIGVYEDIARQCVNNLNFSTFQRWRYYFRMWRAHKAT